MVGPAGAADGPKVRAGALQSVVDCRKLTDPTGRLACYDAAAATLDAAEQSGEVVVIDRAQMREARRATFGFSFRMPGFMTAGESPEALESVEGVVASASQGGDGRWFIRLEDGALWRQVDTDRIPRAPKKGSKVLIKTAAMGSFKMNVDGQTAVRVHREN